MGIFDRVKDRLFGKRYHPGWPRGVKPIFPALAKAKSENEEFWNTISHLPAYVAIQRLRERGLL